MRISELAALVGVSTRAIRHYHHRGLLPEPDRLTNGYREYGLRDAVTLARIRRLAELGLSLDEIRDVLADDQGRELREVLQELDLDLARAQEDIGARRAELARLLAESDLHLDSTVSPELAAVLRGIPAGTSKIAELDRQLLTVLDSLPAELQHGRASVLDAAVHRWLATVNVIPGGFPCRDIRSNHLPEPDEHPGLFLVGDYIFDATLNGVLDSADAATDMALSQVVSLHSARATPIPTQGKAGRGIGRLDHRLETPGQGRGRELG